MTKLYVEAYVMGTSDKVTGWLEVIDGIMFVCEKDPVYGVKRTVVSEIIRYIEAREEYTFFGDEIN